MISIIDYGMGNLRSVEKAFASLGFKAEITRDPKTISKSDKVIFPGVGAFAQCMKNLKGYGLETTVLEAARSGKPFLGICLGLQMLFEESDEGGQHLGLGILRGKVIRFTGNMKVPHMGWNQIYFSSRESDCPILKGVSSGSYVYFVHSYYGIAQEEKVVAARTDYGVQFPSVVWKDHLFATQFHPEKSQEVGLKILKNFGEL
ncbi:MAG: imidazole glycerol phosphate synthase subunit HisH [Chlamydiae bacterium]|nr:imidazole glycerol phosphate synthase subunit HisH [Chlamydiota bacterium]MBI3265997.1 imidazole glycerol phosphate synthase subunit HisH [Chlamydiota bacterium]